MFGIYRTDAEDGGEPVETFDSGAAAGARAGELNASEAEAGSDIRYRVKPITTEEWKDRERERFESGEYDTLPEGWESYAAPDTFPHPSKSEPGKLAYTPSPEYGTQDRQLRCTPGSYLAKFYPILPASEVQRLALLFAGEHERIDLLLATEPDDIVEVYTTGPNSCMGHDESYFNGHLHPTYVYGAGDLAVAYLKPDGRINARVLCWPEQKVYGTTYGDCERLRSALAAEGYESGSLEGAKILKVEDDNGSGYIMPYIDSYYSVDDCGSHFEIASCGDTPADSVDGTTSSRRCCECGCNMCEDETYWLTDREDYACCDCASYCEDCDEHVANDNTHRVHTEDGDERYVCEYCRDNNYTECEDCYESVEDCGILHTDDGSVCTSCFEDSFGGCDECCESFRFDNLTERDDRPMCEGCADAWDEDNEPDEDDDEDDEDAESFS